MREAFGLVGLNALYLAVGTALLYGIGLVRDRRSGLLLAGASFIAGWACVGFVSVLLLVCGLALTAWEVVLAALVLLAAGVALGRRGRGPTRTWTTLGASGLASGVAVAGAALLVVFLEALFRQARVAAPGSFDAWAQWVPKGESIVYFNGLDTHTGGYTSIANPDYPPLASAYEAITFRFVGSVDPTVLPVQHWVVAVAFFAALGGILATRVPPWVLWPSLAGLAVLPNFDRLIGSSLGDEPLALLFGVAAACAALWLLERDNRMAALCGLLLPALTLVKNEGLLLSLLLAAMLALGSLGRLRASWRVLVPLAAAPLLALAPWKIWLRAHDVPGNVAYRLSDLLHPGYLVDRIGRLGTALHQLPAYLLSFDRWLVALPVALVLAALLWRRRPSLTLLVFGTLLVAFLGNAAVYWISRFPIDWYIQTSADRTASSLVVFAAVLTPLLLAEVVRERLPDTDG